MSKRSEAAAAKQVERLNQANAILELKANEVTVPGFDIISGPRQIKCWRLRQEWQDMGGEQRVVYTYHPTKEAADKASPLNTPGLYYKYTIEETIL